MAVRIESIQIKKLGPLDSLKLELGMLNLIYGRNESGKTYLAEFILQSIFRHAKRWNLREFNPEGTLQLQGIENQATTFSPASPRKIEDYWNESDRGLPMNMARLLVVKGGELAMASSSPGGVDRETLKNTLTSQVLLDQIRDSIQSTVQKAQIIGQKVTGKNQGQISDLNALEKELNDIESLLELIEEKYSGGPARQIEEEIEAVRMQYDQLLMAQKHQAYLLSMAHKELIIEREKISDERYLSLRDRVRDHRKLKSDLTKLISKIKTSQSGVDNYHWLESAIEIWEEKELEKKKLPDILLLVAGGGLLAVGLTFLAIQHSFTWRYLDLAGLITAALGGLVLIYFGIRILKGTEFVSETEERQSIESSFQEKFNQTLNGITDLRMRLNQLKDKFLLANSDQKESRKFEIQLETDQHWIKEAFRELTGEVVPEKSWEAELETIKENTAAFDSRISELALQLARFDIPEDEYISEPQDIDFSSQLLTDLEKQLSSLTDELSSHQKELDTLKARASEWTRDDISTPWSEVLHHLRLIRNEISQSHIDLTAELVAKIGLSEIIGKIEDEEDQKILENINAPAVSNLMEKITGKYQKLNLINDQVYASDPYQEYPLRDLSTGAREQIQLALRLGIASSVSGGEPLFLILDDAFQHSDWKRRESLVEETVNLAKSGWQVIYLTMDDHIRDLYLKAGKASLKKEFKLFTL